MGGIATAERRARVPHRRRRPRCRSARPTSSIRFIWPKLLAGLDDYMERHGIDADCRISSGTLRYVQGRTRVDQLLIALDVPTAGEALPLADTLRGSVGGFKIGNQLFTAEGPVIVRTLAAGRSRLPRSEVSRHPQHRRRRGRRGDVARRVDAERARLGRREDDAGGRGRGATRPPAPRDGRRRS